MSKAVLILEEMPKQCICCPCYCEDVEECRATNKDVTVHEAVYVASRPEWCPLVYMSEIKSVDEVAPTYAHRPVVKKHYMIVCTNGVRVVYWYKEFKRYLKDKIVRYNEKQHEYTIGDAAVRFVSNQIYETRAKYGYRGEVIDEDSFESLFYVYLDKYGIWHPQSSKEVDVWAYNTIDI